MDGAGRCDQSWCRCAIDHAGPRAAAGPGIAASARFRQPSAATRTGPAAAAFRRINPARQSRLSARRAHTVDAAAPAIIGAIGGDPGTVSGPAAGRGRAGS